MMSRPRIGASSRVGGLRQPAANFHGMRTGSGVTARWPLLTGRRLLGVGVEHGVPVGRDLALQRQGAADREVRLAGDEQVLGREAGDDLAAVLVTTSCSSMRAADQPSQAGQNVSSANTMPSGSPRDGRARRAG